MKNLWNEYDPDVLASAVDYFASFLEEPNKEVVKKMGKEKCSGKRNVLRRYGRWRFH